MLGMLESTLILDSSWVCVHKMEIVKACCPPPLDRECNQNANALLVQEEGISKAISDRGALSIPTEMAPRALNRSVSANKSFLISMVGG